MIAQGGGYDGPAALKNNPGGTSELKKKGMYRTFNWYTACRLQGSAVEAGLMVCRQVKLREQAE